MTCRADNEAFETFQRRVLRTSLAAAAAAVAVAAATGGGLTPLVIGLAAGCAASLACHRLKVRSLRRLACRPQDRPAGRAALGLALRLGVCAAPLGAASVWPQVGFWGATAGLLWVNGVTVTLAALDARRGCRARACVSGGLPLVGKDGSAG